MKNNDEQQNEISPAEQNAIEKRYMQELAEKRFFDTISRNPKSPKGKRHKSLKVRSNRRKAKRRK